MNNFVSAMKIIFCKNFASLQNVEFYENFILQKCYTMRIWNHTVCHMNLIKVVMSIFNLTS